MLARITTLLSIGSIGLLVSVGVSFGQGLVTTFPSPVPDRIGGAIELDGDRAIIQMPAGATTGPTPQVLIFERLTGGGWDGGVPLPASGERDGVAFGLGIALDGDTAAVGAAYDDTVGPEAGRVAMFELAGGAWIETAVLYPPATPGAVGFGARCSISGDTLAVTRVFGTSALQGEVHLYERASGNWTFDRAVRAPDGHVGDGFGQSLVLDGDRLLIGARFQNSNGPASGRAYVFERGVGDWAQVRVLGGGVSQAFDQFGIDVDLDGDALVVGAGQESDGHVPDLGAAYVFERTGGVWRRAARLLPSVRTGYSFFGSSLSLDSGRLVAGRGGLRQFDLFQRLSSGQWTFTARLSAQAPYRHVWGLALDGETILTTERETFLSSPGQIHEYQIPSGTYGFCFCGDRPACADPSAGCDNSTGRGSDVVATGTTRVAADDLTLTFSGLPAGQPAYAIMGNVPAKISMGNTYRCLDGGPGGTVHFPVQTSGLDGRISLGPGIGALAQSQSGGQVSILAGQTWYFQAWHRDARAPRCGSPTIQAFPTLFNFSSAIAVTFRP